MPTLTTRLGTYGKGSSLSHAEMDANWKRPVTAVTSTPVTLTEAHNRNIIECGSGSGTLALTAAATLAAIDTEDWFVDVVNTTSSAITIDPNGSETIDGELTYSLPSNSSVRLFLNQAQTGFYTMFESRALDPIIMGNIQNPPTFNTTYYVSPFGEQAGASQDANVRSLCPKAGTLYNFYAKVNSNSANYTITLTVRKNNSDTAMTVTIPAASTALVSDTSNTVTVAAGDTLSVKIASGAGTSGTSVGLSWGLSIRHV